MGWGVTGSKSEASVDDTLEEGRPGRKMRVGKGEEGGHRVDRRTQGQRGCGGKARRIGVKTATKLWGGLRGSGPEPRRGPSRLGTRREPGPSPGGTKWGVAGSSVSTGFVPQQHLPTEGRCQGNPRPSAWASHSRVRQEEVLWRRDPVLALADPLGLDEQLSLYPHY